MIEVPNLKIDRDGSGLDELLLLEQDDGSGNVAFIALHPVHIRLIAERVGILAPSSNIEADATIAKLSRRLRLLRDRIAELDGRLWAVPSYPPGSDDPDLWYSDATLDIANEFVADLPPAVAAVNKPEQPAATAPAMPAVLPQQPELELQC